MNRNGQVTLQETVHAPRKVAWLIIGRIYQIRTDKAIFALARVVAKKGGSIDVEYFGTSHAKHLHQRNTPLFKALQPVRQKTRLQINRIHVAQEVL